MGAGASGWRALAVFAVLLGACWLGGPASAGTTSRLTQITYAQRVVVSEINTLRREAHLPAARLVAVDNGLVLSAAAQDRDPNLPMSSPSGGRVIEEYGVWGLVTGYVHSPSPATVVRNWVFDDGWQGASTANRDCTSPSAAGCNGHRRAILSAPPSSGARLAVDVGVQNAQFGGQPAVSVAAILIWSQPTP